ncbi:MAG: beta-lactamase family protein [Chitinophagales bacterium]|nr:beta-lactamase family protein [Chitinophagales bacterium]
MQKQYSLLRTLFTITIVIIGSGTIATAGDGNNLFSNITEQCHYESQSMIQMAQCRASELIDSFYRKRCKNDGFNGAVMVAKDGVPIYSNTFGYANLQKRDTLSLQSSFQLASVSKTLTASAILFLAEKGLVSLDDSIQQFFPEFPYRGITLKMLLSHRTGLPDYTYFPKEYFNTSSKYITNSDVVNCFITRKPPLRCKPDHMFIYCNTNYALLASVVENVSRMSFGEFMNKVIFEPLNMTNTFVYNPYDTAQQALNTYDRKSRIWNDNMYDGVYGDKGIYSSAEDLLKWDVALRSGKILTAESLKEAYTPQNIDRYSFAREKEKNYGYGWRMSQQPDNSYLIYHNGFWHGANTVFARDINNGYTIIVLGNKSNQNNYWTQPVWDILKQLNEVENLAATQ